MPREIRPPQNNLNPDDILTSHEVAHYIKMNPSSVNKWVKEDRIKAYRTPGGHRRIMVSDLYAFLVAHQMPVPNEIAMAVATMGPPKPLREEHTKPGTKAARHAVKKKK